MEDQHTTILNLDPTSSSSSDQIVSFFGVYDGHGGSTAAHYVAEHFTTKLMQSNQYKNKNYTEAMRETYLSLDQEMFIDPIFETDVSGCTAVSCLITPEMKLIVANAGDSRISMSKMGQAITISIDHKPTDEIELARIINAGGFVEGGRVNGNLALSRAFGDFDFKRKVDLTPQQQAVTVDPEMYDIQLTTDDEFIVLACDGIWDVLTNQQVVDFLRVTIASTGSILASINLLMEKCLAPAIEYIGIGCDNMTVVVVAILHGKTFDQWLHSLRESVKSQGLAGQLLTPDGVDTEQEGSENFEFEDADDGDYTDNLK